MTRSRAFKALVSRAYAVCDNDKSGEVGKAELYAGLLLVHLKLAKFAGPAACYVSLRQRVTSFCFYEKNLMLCSTLLDSLPLEKSVISSLSQPIETTRVVLTRKNFPKSWPFVVLKSYLEC